MKKINLREFVNFVFGLVSGLKNYRLQTRLTALLLAASLLASGVIFSPGARAKAQTNLPLKQQQRAPITAPPEPYVSSQRLVSTMLPDFAAAASRISGFYSAAASSVSGRATPEGLGAATPQPAFTERFYGFFAALFAASGKSETQSKESAKPFLPPCPTRRAFDFDGDCKADFSRWQANSFQYKIHNSGSDSYTTLNLGSSGSKIAPADFDGDGKFDMTVFSAGSWTVRKSSNNTNWGVSWGMSGDLPVPADYDGDGTADFAIYRPSTNSFWVLTSSSNYASYTYAVFGASGDIIVPGNFDGDAKADYAVFRPSTGYWYYLPSSGGGGAVGVPWGLSTDIPVPGDYDGDGTTDCAVFRPSTGTWYMLKSTGGSPNYLEASWGNFGDQPVPADYDGDGISDVAIYRPTSGSWWVSKSSGGSPNYTVHNLGTPTDLAVPSAYLKQSGAELYPNQSAPARLAPINATGSTNYYSRNSGWTTDLVSLPGRSGLNLNIGMSYNSLVWTKIGSVIAFDMDRSNLAPGFNFGFPRIEPAYINSQTSILSYLMVLPSGARTEFRQTGAGDTYETADSSFAQIKVNNPGTSNSPTSIEDMTLTVTATDGTQMSYSWIGGAYRCTQIKDSNGNYITISHNNDGLLTSVTDTLGRVVTVNYDGYNRVSSITQNWLADNGSGSATTHTWASFTYTTQTISTSFASTLSVFGPANSTSVSVLQKVTFADGSYTKFDYNAYAQVYKVSNYAYNNDLLKYEWRNIETPSSNQIDCPRFTQTKTKVANFNAGNEVTVNNTFATGQSYTLPDSTNATGTKIEILTPDRTGAADALVTRVFSPSSGWSEGLPVLSEDHATEGSTLTKKRWSWTSYTQEDTNLSYIKNPRIAQTKIGDGVNTKHTKIYYLMQPNSSTVTQYGLVDKIEILDGSEAVLRTRVTGYNLDSNYLARRIIGLPSETLLYEGTSTSGTLLSKLTYNFDENGYAGTGQSVTATQHDATNYGTAFGYRGNLTSTKRWDVSDALNSSLAVSSQIKYNVTGSQISQTDPRGRVSSISYIDVWNDTARRSDTYAYPTTVTDAGGYSSTMKYRYDTGANIWTRNPTPSGSGNTYGKTTAKTYDDVTGRMIKEKIENSGLGAYTRYEYSGNGASINTYTTIVDANNDGNIDSNDEVATETLFDGAGRMRRTRTENPDAANRFTGKLVEYNILGELKRETVPTKIDSSWNPADEDYRGMNGNDYIWLWNSREYDWKGRLAKEINTDGTDRLYSYAGCGCAGGEVTTVKGEITTATDVAGNQQTTKRRTQKTYEDLLGRTVKNEIWDLDGGGSAPYSTTVTTYNGRDQVTNVRQYAGASSSTTYQDTTMTYDGHGRLSTRHFPEENQNTYTQWTYKADDAIASVTDPRGAVTTYKYGNLDDSASSEYRALLTKITYSVPQNSTIPVPSDVNFTYDAAGNKTYMTDGTGNLTYSYDELSRLKSETKNFADTLAEAPTGGYQLRYTYHLAGGLKSVGFWFGSGDADPMVVNYSADILGRASSITGSGFYDDYDKRDVTSFASNISYRAFGSLKSMTYSTDDPTQISLDYNTRLRPVSYEANSAANSGDVQNVSYAYYNDGNVKEAVDSVDSRFSQYYDYDFAGRLKRNNFGSSGVTQPFSQTIGYDAFGNMTSRSTWTWGVQRSFTASYTNNRKSSGGFQSGVDTFDAAGNVTQNVIYSGPTNIRKWKFDAAGRMTDWEETLPYITTLWDQGAILTFDGEGRAAKRLNRKRNRANGNTSWYEDTEYSLFSSVTGQRIASLSTTGGKHKTFVYMENSVIAEHSVVNNTKWLKFKYNAPVTGSIEETAISGEITPYMVGRVDFEALGGVIPPEEEELQTPVPNYQKGGFLENPEYGCNDPMDGSPMPCNVAEFLNNHLASIAWTIAERYGNFSDSYFQRLERARSPEWAGFVGADNVNLDTPGLSVRHEVYGDGLVIESWIMNAQTNKKQKDLEKLPKERSKAAKKARSALINDLKKDENLSEDCKKNVIEPLESIGVNMDGFLKYLKEGAKFYNGETSQISIQASIGNQLTNIVPGTDLSIPIGIIFKKRDSSGLPVLDAITSASLSTKRLTAFLSPQPAIVIDKALIFHEALHGYASQLNGGVFKGAAIDLSDDMLQHIFNKKTAREVTEFIREHCFK